MAWIPVLSLSAIVPGKIHEFTWGGQPYFLYGRNKSSLQAFSSVCPHQAASLAKGWIKDECIVCPYHGLRFRLEDGRYEKQYPEAYVPKLDVVTDKDLVYVQSPKWQIPLFQPPEETNPDFVSFSGSIRIPQNADVVTENVLDMLHISYVHHFGNREEPLPYGVRTERLTPHSGRSTFSYRSGPRSLSKNVARADHVYVENEYHLPSTTVTRVRAGDQVKTVVTRALNVNDKETILFYKLYRNFWTDNAVITTLGTLLLRGLMLWTLWEDTEVLKHVDASRRQDGFATVYDRNILNYRAAKKSEYGEVRVDST